VFLFDFREEAGQLKVASITQYHDSHEMLQFVDKFKEYLTRAAAAA
jgi:hypothetical protein